jgi:hypothetical protein
MSDDRQHGTPPIDHEIDARAIYRIGAWLAVVTVAAFLVAWGGYLLLARGERALDAPPSPLAEARQPTLPPGPQLQAWPELDLAAFRRLEAARMAEWSWVDEAGGVARVPVERAIDQIIADGALPDFFAQMMAGVEW